MTENEIEKLEKRVNRLDFLELCDKYAEKNGLDVETLVWTVIRGLMVKAANGNLTAARMLLDRFFGAVPRGPAIQVDARSVHQHQHVEAPTATGPKPPSLLDFGAYLAKLNQVAESQGVKPGADPLADIADLLGGDALGA